MKFRRLLPKRTFQATIFIVIAFLALLYGKFLSTSFLKVNNDNKILPTIPVSTITGAFKPSPTEGSIPNQQQNMLNEFIYPNSKEIDNSSTRITLENEDTPEVIQAWYKEKLHSLHFSTTSITVSKTNTNTAIHLSANNKTQTIQIDITRLGTVDVSTITISAITY